MGHYAKVLNDVVQKVICADADYFDDFIDDTPGEWIKCSYNTFGGVHYQPDVSPLTPSDDQSKALRYNFPGVGYFYDKDADAFYAPQVYESWTLNTETYMWEPPVPFPDDFDSVSYGWNEEEQQWDMLGQSA